VGTVVAADAVDPEDIAAGVHMHVVAFGWRADLNPVAVGSPTPPRGKSTVPRSQPWQPTGGDSIGLRGI
jgi:hypothetical protein